VRPIAFAVAVIRRQQRRASSAQQRSSFLPFATAPDFHYLSVSVDLKTNCCPAFVHVSQRPCSPAPVGVNRADLKEILYEKKMFGCTIRVCSLDFGGGCFCTTPPSRYGPWSDRVDGILRPKL
jgi:hypothetical protein